MWYSLSLSFAFAALFLALWTNLQPYLQTWKRWHRHALMSVVLSFGVIATMSSPVQFGEGVFLDLRSAVIGTAGYFAGPLGAVATAGTAAVIRLVAGGQGQWAGLAGIGLSALVGLSWYFATARGGRNWASVFGLSFSIATVPLVSLLLLPESVSGGELAAPLFVVNLLATLIAAVMIRIGKLRAEEHFMLRAAIEQAPEFLYLKDRGSRFVAVNQAVATAGGKSSPGEMRGLTDRDVAPPERAVALLLDEQRIIQSGQPILDLEEEVRSLDAPPRWYITSKRPVLNADGEVIGIAGVTHDVTERRRLQEEVEASRRELSFALMEMSDGFAMFDRDGILVLCNDRYRSMFPRTAEFRHPGASMINILRASISSGEQVGIDPETWDEWVARTNDERQTGGDQEVEMFDGRWLLVRTRPAPDGSALVLVSDITVMKQSQMALRQAADQMRQLATTDGLTGIANRRTFDEHMETQLLRCLHDVAPMSLLLIDIDSFKAYNDTYGHRAGDQCLRIVAGCVASAAKRATDTAARYGGEEFVLLLPEMDRSGAAQVAEDLRRAVEALQVPHSGSRLGTVTISIGVASLDPVTPRGRSAELVEAADAELYSAKAKGRNQVSVSIDPVRAAAG